MYIKTINGLDAGLRLRFFSRLSIMEVWILWIISKTEYFGFWIHAPKRFFATDPNGVNTASGNTKQF